MKKLALYLSIIVALFAVLYLINYLSEQQTYAKYEEPAKRLYNTTPDKLSKPTREQLTDENYQKIILPEQLDEKLKNGEDLIVYMFSPVCQYCRETTPILNEIAKETGVDYWQLNVYEFTEQFDKYRLTGTPTLIAFKNGEEVERISGGIADIPGNTRSDFQAFLEKHKP
jgi:Thiol-disulfide isomerase and thioredoxins